ncbi:hypothetical protein B296_00047339, partial [Ensete ventricosum]
TICDYCKLSSASVSLRNTASSAAAPFISSSSSSSDGISAPTTAPRPSSWHEARATSICSCCLLCCYLTLAALDPLAVTSHGEAFTPSPPAGDILRLKVARHIFVLDRDRTFSGKNCVIRCFLCSEAIYHLLPFAATSSDLSSGATAAPLCRLPPSQPSGRQLPLPHLLLRPRASLRLFLFVSTATPSPASLLRHLNSGTH